MTNFQARATRRICMCVCVCVYVSLKKVEVARYVCVCVYVSGGSNIALPLERATEWGQAEQEAWRGE